MVKLANDFCLLSLVTQLEPSLNPYFLAHLAGVAEYIDCISAERLDSSNECPDTKQSDAEDLVMELWGM